MKLSIIVPVYNTEKYLPACLDSAVSGGAEGYEIIIVNDGSTDGSQAVIDNYVNQYPQLIRSVTTENGGLGAARNVGIDMARGEYLQFLDSDDRLSENAVPEMLETVRSGYDIYIFHMVSVTESGNTVGTLSGCGRRGEVSLSRYPRLLTELPSACNKLIRRRLFTDTGIRFPSRVWYEDLRTIPKLYLHTDSIFVTGCLWYEYLMRQGSITNSTKLMRNLEITDAVDDLLGYYRRQGQYDRYAPELEYVCFYNQFLTSSVRVCSADPRCPAVEQLKRDFLSRCPEWKSNKYIKVMSTRHKLLTWLLMRGMGRSVALLMRLNSRMRGKQF